MKKFSKIFLSLALVLVLALPMLAGCSLSDLLGDNANKVSNDGKKIASIEVVGEMKTTYYAKEEIDFGTAKLQINYEDASSQQINLSKTMVSNFDTTTFGTKQMTITYNNMNYNINYNVNFKLGKYRYVLVEQYYNNNLVATMRPSEIGGAEFMTNGKFIEYTFTNATAREQAMSSQKDWYIASLNGKLYGYYNGMNQIVFTSATTADWIALYSDMPKSTNNNDEQSEEIDYWELYDQYGNKIRANKQIIKLEFYE